jgi:hypothetical protein
MGLKLEISKEKEKLLSSGKNRLKSRVSAADHNSHSKYSDHRMGLQQSDTKVRKKLTFNLDESKDNEAFRRTVPDMVVEHLSPTEQRVLVTEPEQAWPTADLKQALVIQSDVKLDVIEITNSRFKKVIQKNYPVTPNDQGEEEQKYQVT